MTTAATVRSPADCRPPHPPHADPRALARCGVLAAALASPAAVMALDFGPFSLTGFAKAEAVRVSDYCPDCQLEKNENKQRFWADELVQGKAYGGGTTHVTLFQPYLGVKFDLPRGFKLSALLSQRFRDGDEDFPGIWYDKNIAISHEDWGSLRIGAMTTRAWSIADYPYGSNVGVSDAWASSGSGYGLLTRAVRYTSRVLDVAEGDLVLEATYDAGKSGWRKNKPQFWELWAQFRRGDLGLDAMYQDARNGTPSAFGHGPFTSLTPFSADDPLLGSSSQSIAMLMATYQVNTQVEVSGGVRANRWSGAYASITTSGGAGAFDQWNNMFNVDWTRDLGGGVFRGYPARSTDLMLGLRYRTGPWTASTGVVYLGKASTDNPTERGQSNTATINTVGLSYDYGRGLQLYLLAGMVNYTRLGLSPTTTPSNSAFTNIDSRLKTQGQWFGIGATYVF